VNITPIPTQPDISAQTGSTDTGAKPSGFAELLDAAQAKVEHTSSDGPDATAADPTATDEVTVIEDGGDAAEGTEPTEGEPVEDDSAVPDDAASQLLAASVATHEVRQPADATSTEVAPGALTVADVTAELNANTAAKAETATVKPAAVAAETVPAVAAAATKQAVAAEAAAVVAATTPTATAGDGTGDVPRSTPTGDTSQDGPVTETPTDPPAPTDATGDPTATPELPIEPGLPSVPDAARTDVADVAEALAAVVDAPAPAPTPDPALAPRVTPARVESPVAPPSASAAASTIAPPVNTAPTPGASSTPVQVSATPTPVAPHTPPQEQVAAAIAPLHQRADGVYRLRLELHPAELGYVEVDVELRNGVLSANLRAEHLSAAHVLRDALADLRGRLEQQGVRAGEMTVDGRGPGTAGRERQAGGAAGARANAGRRGNDGGGGDDHNPRPRQQPTELQETVLDLRM
jgi:flagellar hook-length control protein FliK